MGLLNIAQTYVFGAALSALFGIDWEDYMAAYYDIPDYMRYNNIVILSSGGNVYRIPLSPAFAPYKTLVENVGEAVYRTFFNDKDGKYDLAKGVGDILKSLSANLGDPINWDAPGAKKLVGLAPAPFTGLAELIGNVDFTGRPIYREGNSTSPGYKNVYSRTKDFYVDAGRWLNELSGGEPSYGKGLGHINPAMVEHYVESWVGGAGDFVVKTFGVGKSAWNVLSGESGPFMGGRYEQIPFVGTFYAGDSDFPSVGEVVNQYVKVLFYCAGGGIEPPFAKTEPATDYREGGLFGTPFRCYRLPICSWRIYFSRFILFLLLRLPFFL